MEAKILFKETIKPSYPTPEHLKTYKLSLLDQLTSPLYAPVVLFYSSSSNQTFLAKSGHLKKSLSETLTAFYPLAGRIKDIYSIDCNDQGASYIEAHIPGEMSMILQNPDISQLEKLLPFDPYYQINPNDQVLLAVQVNRFDCGGIAISICIWHRIGDASAVGSFASSWGAIASGAQTSTDMKVGIVDCTSIFPPQDTRSISFNKLHDEKDMLSNIMTKRFVFDGSKLAALRERMGKYCPSYPTRVETIAAVILNAVSSLKSDDTNTYVAAVVVNLRKRMNPPFPELSLGSICQGATTVVNCSKNANRIEQYKNIIGKIHDSVANMKDDYVRKMHEGGKYFELVREVLRENSHDAKNFFAISSWCRFPFYETDFGWGKPVWVSTAVKLSNAVVLIDTKDGQGIEAWMSLPKDDMPKFQQNPDVCCYASIRSSL